MGAEAAVGILHRRRLAAADVADREALLARLVDEHETGRRGLGRALDLGVVDEVIAPCGHAPQTRRGVRGGRRNPRKPREHPTVNRTEER